MESVMERDGSNGTAPNSRLSDFARHGHLDSMESAANYNVGSPGMLGRWSVGSECALYKMASAIRTPCGSDASSLSPVKHRSSVFNQASPCRRTSRLSESPVKGAGRRQGRSSVLDFSGADSFFMSDTLHLLSPGASIGGSPTKNRALEDVEEEDTPICDYQKSTQHQQATTSSSCVLFRKVDKQAELSTSPRPELTSMESKWREGMDKLSELAEHLHRREQEVNRREEQQHQYAAAVYQRELLVEQEMEQLTCRKEEIDQERRNFLLMHIQAADDELMLRKKALVDREAKLLADGQQLACREQALEADMRHVQEAEKRLACQREELQQRELRIAARERVHATQVDASIQTPIWKPILQKRRCFLWHPKLLPCVIPAIILLLLMMLKREGYCNLASFARSRSLVYNITHPARWLPPSFTAGNINSAVTLGCWTSTIPTGSAIGLDQNVSHHVAIATPVVRLPAIQRVFTSVTKVASGLVGLIVWAIAC